MRQQLRERIEELRSIDSEERQLEEAAAQIAAEGGKYRRPHIKRRGKAREARLAELEEAEQLLAEYEGKDGEGSASAEELAEIFNSLQAARRDPNAPPKFDDADVDEDDDEGIDDEFDESDSASPKELSPAAARRAAGRARARQAEAEVLSTADAKAAAATDAAMPDQLVAHVESELRRLDAATHHTGVGGRGIGFDSIDLSRTVIGEDEVFDNVVPTAGVRKLMEAARKGDSGKRMQLQRIERVTEKTKEIVGRVLLEESIKIGNVQQHLQQQHQSQSKSSSSSRSSSPTSIRELIDLRSTPSFHIHEVRYSTDLGWVSFMWTLGKTGFDSSIDPDDPTPVQQSRPSSKQRQRSGSHSSTSSTPSSPSLPNWFVTRRRIIHTLDHMTKSIRFTLGRELDLKYTPSVKFTYDDLHDARLAQQEAERKQLEEEEERTRQLLAQLADPSLEDTQLTPAQQRARAMGESGGDFTEEEMALSRAADARFDEERRWFLPKRKIASLVQREKAKKARWDAKQKKKQLIRQAVAATKGVPTRPSAPPPPETTDPTVLKNYLRQEMARLVQQKNPNRKEVVTQLIETRAQMTQLQQLKALRRKSMTNPIEELKEKRRQTERPQYPKDWKRMKDKYWKTTDGRTRSKAFR